MDNQKTQIIDRLGQATNILVTVSVNPSVDQLAAAIGLTLLLNKLGKHATAVFSGQVPSTLEFLQPEKTLETNTDSLRDFIIALDKSKADKLRYKVEDQSVKIFITPYRTSISDKDLEFSQGDFNVEVVMALGVSEQTELDEAITAHGRILHDATVIGINLEEGVNLGSMNWAQPGASSLCEMLVELGLNLKEDILDGQMATAFLTGIVSETNRFSNEKTSSATMQMSAKLMAAGANQQLVASELQTTEPDLSTEASAEEEAFGDTNAELPEVENGEPMAKPPKKKAAKQSKADDGSLHIDHEEVEPIEGSQPPTAEKPNEEGEQIQIDDSGNIKPIDVDKPPQPTVPELAPMTETEPTVPEVESSISEVFQTPDEQVQLPAVPEQLPGESDGSRLVLQPPILGGKLTANSVPEALDPSTDPLGMTNNQAPLLTHDVSADDSQIPSPNFATTTPLPQLEDVVGSTSSADTPLPDFSLPVDTTQQSPNTLSDLEKVVDSPHLSETSTQPSNPEIMPELPGLTPEIPQPSQEMPSVSPPPPDLNAARDAVNQAVKDSPNQVLEPVQSLNAQPMDLNLGDMPAVNTSPASAFADSSPTFTPYSPTPSPISDDSVSQPLTIPVPDPNQQSTQVPPDPVLPVVDAPAPALDPVESPPPPVPPPMMPPMISPVVPPPDDPNSPSDTAL